MRSRNLEIASPCHESWDAMEGGEERRFCGICQKDVHNLSAMAHADATALLAEKAGEHLCVRYTSEADGSLRFRDLVPRASLTRKIVRTAFAASMLAACTPHGDGPPISDLGQSVIESIREQTVPTSDGGCDYSTGPFTTFHLPAGHVLCRQDERDEPMRIVEPPPPPQPPPPPTPTMGAPLMAPPPPPPVIDPPPRMKMGEAIMAPEGKDPFVPCDPKPGFAPPPPPEPGMERMGDIASPPPPSKPSKPSKPRSEPLMGDIMPERPEPEELMGKIAAPVD